jgi:hypothetical protein
MVDILAKTASTQERWDSDTEAYLPKAFKRIKRQENMHNHSLSRNTGPMVRSALLEFIGKFGFFSLHVFSHFPLGARRRILSISLFFHFTTRGRLRLT